MLKSLQKRLKKKRIGSRVADVPPPAGTPSIDNTNSSKLPVNQAKTALLSDKPEQHITPATALATSNAASSYSTETHVPSSLPHAADPPAETYQGPKERQTITEVKEEQVSELSTSQRLWNAADDSLEKDKDTAELANSYMKTLIKVLNPKKDSDSSAYEDEVLAKLKDPIERQEYMTQMVDEGRKKVAVSSKILGTTDDVAKFILSAKGMIDLAIQNIPQAALPWAGVCIGLQILLNPGKATKANLAGITHVTSRMKWYCAMTEYLFNKDSIVLGNESFTTVINILEEKIIELYKSLILYQMSSINSYYRNQGVVFLRSVINLDDWDGDLESVKKAEAVIEHMSAQYHREYERSSLHQIVDAGKEMEKQLGDIHRDLQSFIAQQENIEKDKKDRDCLHALFVTDPSYDMKRIEKTKDTLLHDAFKWILSTDEYIAFTSWSADESTLSPLRLLWIKGSAGTGKTMLLIGIIRELRNQSATFSPRVSHFFCQGTENNRNSATAVLRSLIWMLLLQQPYLISHLLIKYEPAGPSLFSDPNAYFVLSDIFENMLTDSRLSRAYLIVDALDECSEGLEYLIQLISTSISLCEKVKWLVASRPEVELNNLQTDGALVELDAQILKRPVNAYIDYKLSLLGGRRGYSNDILGQVSRKIHQKAANIFLWVALVFKQLDKVHGWNAVEAIDTMPPGLSELYNHMMAKIEILKDAQYCKKILVAIFLAYRPLSLLELSVLADLPDNVDAAQTIVEECGLFLTIKDKIVYLIHQSAKDYLDTNYTIKLHQSGLAEGHMETYSRSIKAISKLQQNIYSLPDFGFRPKDTQPPDPDPLAPMRYAFLFWADHFCDAHKLSPELTNEPTDADIVWSFLNGHILRWIEGLSLLGKISDGLRLLRKILLEPRINAQLARFLKDAETFLLSNGSIIDRAPLQVYGSALLFCPGSNKVKQQQWNERLPFIKDIEGIKEHNVHLQTLEGHSGFVNSIAFSPDGKTLASASDDKTIRLWDAATGAHQQILEGHSDWINTITFSPDSKILASASYDKTIRLWDVATGTHQQILEGHNGWVRAITFSPDGKTLALASHDNTIRLWDTAMGTHQHILEGHSESVNTITFSPNGKTLASASNDKTIRLWHAATGAHQQILEGHSDWINTIAFSPDGKTLASASDDKTIRLWHAATGAHQQTLKKPSGLVSAIVFSTDSQFLKTDRGYIRISELSIPDKPPGYACFVHEDWITRDGKHLLFLPKDYRSEQIVLHGNLVVLGHESGLTFLRFNF